MAKSNGKHLLYMKLMNVIWSSLFKVLPLVTQNAVNAVNVDLCCTLSSVNLSPSCEPELKGSGVRVCTFVTHVILKLAAPFCLHLLSSTNSVCSALLLLSWTPALSDV